MGLRIRGSYRSLRESHHFLDSCFLCHKRLTPNSDIFMYRGDTAFCSEECRGEQMEMDEAKERSLKKITMKVSLREERESTKSTSSGVTVLVG